MNLSLTNITTDYGNFTDFPDFMFGSLRPGLRHFGYVRFVVSITIIIINMLEIIILGKRGNNRCIPDYLVLSLSVADLTVGVLYGLLDILAMVQHLLPDDVVMVSMIIINPCTWFSIHASVLHTVCIGIERFLAVRYPLHYRGIMTKTKVILCVLALWLFILISIVVLFIINFKLWYTLTLPTTEACIIISSGVLLALIYGYIGWYVSAKRRMNKNKDFRHRQSNITYANCNETKKTVFCIMIAWAFIICSYPLGFSWLLGIYHPAPHFVLLINSLLNPLIYFWKGYGNTPAKGKAKKSVLSTDISGQP